MLAGAAAARIEEIKACGGSLEERPAEITDEIIGYACRVIGKRCSGLTCHGWF